MWIQNELFDYLRWLRFGKRTLFDIFFIMDIFKIYLFRLRCLEIKQGNEVFEVVEAWKRGL